MNLYTAHSVKTEVRKFYKQGLKSANKGYANVDNEQLNDANLVAKRKTRNDHQAEAAVSLERLRAETTQPGVTPYSLGKYIDATEAKYGNCLEMACYALFLALDNGLAGHEQLWVARIGGISKHSYCLYNKRGFPGEISLTDLARPNAARAQEIGPEAVVIDPWLNIACLTKDFAQLAADKLGEWSQSGKRIATGGEREEPEWSPSGGDYRASLLSSDARFTGSHMDLYR